MAGESFERAVVPVSALLLGALIVAEVNLQLRHRVQSGEWWPVTLTQSRGLIEPVSDRREFRLAPGYQDGTGTGAINEDGFRGPVVPASYEGQLVCVLGDSTLYGYGLSDDATIPALLERRARAFGRDVRVINGATPSYTFWQSLDRYFLDVVPRRRAEVVVLQSSNDVSLLSQYRDQWTPTRTWASIRYASAWRGLGLSGRFLTLERVRGFVGDRRPAPGESFRRFPPDRMLAHLETTLAERLPQLAAQGTQVILLPISFFSYATETPERRNDALRLWPRWGRLHQTFTEAATQVNHLLETMAGQYESVHFLDIDRRMDELDRNELFRDLGHFTPRGAGYIAEQLQRFIEDNRLLRPGDAESEAFERASLDGFGLARAGDHVAAIKRYDEALGARPDHPLAPQVLNNRGWSLTQLGRFAEAERSFELALALVPGFPLARNNLSRVRAAQGSTGRAATRP